MKVLIFLLAVLFVLLQYALWFSHGGLRGVVHLKKEVAQQEQVNSKIYKTDQLLVAKVKDLKHGKSRIESLAREEMGMVKKGETFYQVVERR